MKNNELNVIVVNDFNYIQGGASKVAIDTAKLLYENNVNVTLFSATHKENNYNFKQVCTNQKECLKDGLRGALRGIYNFKVKKEFTKLLNSFDRKNTIIHVHGWTKSLSSVIFKVAARKKFKIVLTLHDYFTSCPNGGFYNYQKCEICHKNSLTLDCIKTNCDSRNYFVKVYRCIRQFVQKINMKDLKNYIYISDFSKNILSKNLDGNFYKLYNPIPKEKKDIIDITKNDYYVFVGRIDKEKGVELFCEAMERLNKKAKVIGDGTLRESLKDKFKNIDFVGWKNSEEVEEYMMGAKALVFPSRWYEGAPLTILESLALGLPCVVSDKCAAIDFINDGNGMSFDGTVEDLIEKIKIYETKNLKKLSQSAYDNYWKDPFDINKYYKNLIKIYKKIVLENNYD